MKIHLVHHVHVPPADQGTHHHISEIGRGQADRLANRFRALGAAPVRILHSHKQWSIDTARHIAAKLGLEARMAEAAYPIQAGDPIAPFITEIAATDGDLMMCGHAEYLSRSASRLVCGDEARKVVEFRPGHGTAVGLEGAGNEWVITYVWRQDHAPG